MPDDYSLWINTCSYIKWYCSWNRFVFNRCVWFLLYILILNNGIFHIQFFKINLWIDYCSLGYVFIGWWLNWQFLDSLLTWNVSWFYIYIYTYIHIYIYILECGFWGRYMDGRCIIIYVYKSCGALRVLIKDYYKVCKVYNLVSWSHTG